LNYYIFYIKDIPMGFLGRFLEREGTEAGLRSAERGFVGGFERDFARGTEREGAEVFGRDAAREGERSGLRDVGFKVLKKVLPVALVSLFIASKFQESEDECLCSCDYTQDASGNYQCGTGSTDCPEGCGPTQCSDFFVSALFRHFLVILHYKCHIFMHNSTC
jgi:hypothetical protein